MAALYPYYSTTFTSVVLFLYSRRLLFLSFFVSGYCSFHFFFSALVGEPRVSSGRFSVSFPFEPASNLTAAVSAVFPGSSVAFLFVSAFSFSSPFPVSCSFHFSFSALVGEPRVSSGRFSVSFPFEPASNLTAAVSAVFPGSSVAFLFVSAFSFSSPFPVSCSFLLSFSAPLRRAAGLVGTVFGEFSF